MGWIYEKGGMTPAYVLNGPGSGNTLPGPREAVPACIVVCRQNSYSIYPSAAAKDPVELPSFERVFSGSTPWRVVSARVQLTRYYAASNAKVVLATNINEMDDKVPPPGLTPGAKEAGWDSNGYSIDDMTTQEVRPEMEIEVWLGYLPHIGIPAGSVFPEGPDERYFSKVFHGVIDTVSMKMGRGDNPQDGITCTITARDTMRYLIDNKFFGELHIPDADFGSTLGVPRTQIVEYLIKQGSAGAVGPAGRIGGIKFHESGRPPMVVSPILKTVAGSDSTRTPILVNGNVPFSIPDQFPVDVIRWFSVVEPVPRELYCDIDTGQIAWTVRMLGEPYYTGRGSSGTVRVSGVKWDIPESVQGKAPDTNVDKLWEAILKAGASAGVSRDDAVNYADALIRAFETTPEDYKRILDIAMVGGTITQETKWRNVTDPKTAGGQNGCFGIGQLKVAAGPQGQHYKDGGGVTYEDAINPIKALALVVLHFCGAIGKSSKPKTLNWLYKNGFIASLDDAQKIAMQCYNSGTEDPMRACYRLINGDNNWDKAISLSGKRKPITYAQMKAKMLQFCDPKTTPTTSNATPMILAQMDNYVIRNNESKYVKNPSRNDAGAWTYRDYYFKEYAGVTGKGTQQVRSYVMPVPDASNHGATYFTESISVRRGENDPWVYTYKRPAGAVKPNIISAHADWSTLGVVTRFTLINPVVEQKSQSGSGAIRASHSLFGAPSPDVGFDLENVAKTSARTPALDGGGTYGPEAIRGTKEKTVGEKDPKTGKLYYSPGDASLGLKFASKINFPVRNRYLWDETADRRTETVADLILNSMLNIHGQDIHAADILVPMNPDIRPGHAVQVYNLGYYHGELMRAEGVIHMFASGGVHNGCTTMVALASKQGSYDPRKIPEIIQKIRDLQGRSADYVSKVAGGEALVGVTTRDYEYGSLEFKNLNKDIQDVSGPSEALQKASKYAYELWRYYDAQLRLHSDDQLLQKAAAAFPGWSEDVRRAYVADLRGGKIPIGYDVSDLREIAKRYCFQYLAEYLGGSSSEVAYGKPYGIDSAGYFDGDEVQAVLKKYARAAMQVRKMIPVCGAEMLTKTAAEWLLGLPMHFDVDLRNDSAFQADLSGNNHTIINNRADKQMQPRAFKLCYLELSDWTTAYAYEGVDLKNRAAAPTVFKSRTAAEVMSFLESEAAKLGPASIETPEELVGMPKAGTFHYNVMVYDWWVKQFARVNTWCESPEYKAQTADGEKVRALVDELVDLLTKKHLELEKRLDTQYDETQKVSDASAVKEAPDDGEGAQLADLIELLDS